MAYNNNRERYEFIERMFVNLSTLPIERVIGQYIPLSSRGRHLMGLCPFHKDTKLGSFIVTPDKHLWKCFTCGDEYAGNSIKFVSLYMGLSYLDASFRVARDFGVITAEEYDRYAKKRYDESYVKSLERRYSDQVKDEPKPVKAPADVIANVYQVIKDNCALSDEHRNSLIKTRHLTKERIERDYFSCPTNWKLKDNIVLAIKKKYPAYTDDILKTVPGFFYDKKHNKISFAGYKGLGILIRDANDKIEAIQIRRDTIKEGDSRYIWLSSTFAFYKPEEYEGGCGCGSPKDVLWPETPSKRLVCITEGRFKSEILAQNGNTTISIQGVTSWSGIDKAIGDIRAKNNAKVVYIFLDADIFSNHALFVQSTKMCAYIAEKFPDLQIKYAFWHKSVGKGIDDYLINGGSMKEINYVDYQKAAIEGESVFNDVLKKYGVSKLQDLPNDKVSTFQTDLQTLCEKHFLP